MKQILKLLVAASLLAVGYADTINVCSTGFTVRSTSGCGAAPVVSPASGNNLLADGNWYVSSNTSGTFQSSAYVTVNGVGALIGSPYWMNDNTAANGVGSAWIVPTNSQSNLYANNTVWYYAIQFTIGAGLNPASATLSGGWAADDYATGAGIYLNGVAVTQASLPGYNTFQNLTNFVIPAGASFQSGVNTLVFALKNDASGNGGSFGPNYSGVNVRFANSNVLPSVPEPGTVFLIGSALLGLGYMKRRHKQRGD